MPSVIHIRADDREQRSTLISELRNRLEFELVVERLTVGDYCVDGRFLVKRKTLTDLAVSIRSGRLYTQALRLAEMDDLQPALLLEGQSLDPRRCGMRWEAISGGTGDGFCFHRSTDPARLLGPGDG